MPELGGGLRRLVPELREEADHLLHIPSLRWVVLLVRGALLLPVAAALCRALLLGRHRPVQQKLGEARPARCDLLLLLFGEDVR